MTARSLEVFSVAPHRSWPDLVFHVLAHVAGTSALPASVFDDHYVRYVASRVAPFAGRTLHEDVALIAGALPDHPSLAAAQLVATLFDDVEDALALEAVDLADLPVPFEVRRRLAPIGGAVELLRCAALLEMQTVAALPSVTIDAHAFQRALADVAPACPTLPKFTFVHLRALRLRGRLVGSEIWLGAPSEALALSHEHVAWQAAHEATVGEVAAASTDAERAVEQMALVLLHERAARVGLTDRHQRWLDHLHDLPPLSRAALAPAQRARLDELTSWGGGA